MNILIYASPLLLIIAAVLIRRWLTCRILAARVKSLQLQIARVSGHLYSAITDYNHMCLLRDYTPKDNPAKDINHPDAYISQQAAYILSLQNSLIKLKCALDAAKKEQRIN